MGRRKIEIRPIKDDRNRSVTFLKRKGGLFKKAYELGVLCSVDVAVIVFGNNKKVYEFCSGDIGDTINRFTYFNGSHEHKGPEDFTGKSGGDDDEDEDAGSASPTHDTQTPPEPATYAPPLPTNRTSFHRMRGATPSASPPLPNGNKRASPQPRTHSRSSSRASASTHMSNVPGGPHGPVPQAQMTQGGYGYAHPQQYHPPHPQHYPSEHPHQHESHHYQTHLQRHPPPHYPGPYLRVQEAYEQDQRRQSLPPTFQPQQHQHQDPQHWHNHDALPPHASPQPHMYARTSVPLPPRHSPRLGESQPSPPLPQPKPSPVPSKSHSIFTPIDESRSVLAQHWSHAPTSDTASTDTISATRAHSIDVAALAKVKAGSTSPTFPKATLHLPPNVPPPLNPPRSASTVSLSSAPQTARSSTFGSDARRPRLTVKIPTEASEAEENTADSSAQDASVNSSLTAQPAKNVVLPPPSPSANNPLHSAGASGPPNPFARPAPPSTNRELETPLSALPSRVMEGNMLPSPSDIWGNMFSRSSTDNSMPSPLNFQPTPTASNGGGFKEEVEDRKRKASDDMTNAEEKRIKA